MHSQRLRTLQSSGPPSPPSEFWLNGVRRLLFGVWEVGRERVLTRENRVGLKLSWHSLPQLLKLQKLQTLQTPNSALGSLQ